MKKENPENTNTSLLAAATLSMELGASASANSQPVASFVRF